MSESLSKLIHDFNASKDVLTEFSQLLYQKAEIELNYSQQIEKLCQNMNPFF